MSEDNKDIGKLLKSIQEGLQRYSVQELNKALTSFLKKGGSEDITFKIDYALQIVCDEYNVSRYFLINANERGDIQDAKRIAYCLLHYNLGLTIRYIAANIFNCYPNSVATGIKKYKNADVNIKHEKIFLDKYHSLRKKLIDNINQHEIQHTQHENIS
jgi:hypothetical protein